MFTPGSLSFPVDILRHLLLALRSTMLVKSSRGAWTTRGVVSCVAYVLANIFMSLSNKAIAFTSISSYQLVLYQCVFTVALVWIGGVVGVVYYKPVKYRHLKRWVFPSLGFVAMLVSGQASMRRFTVPMITLSKNFTLVFIALGDRVLFDHRLTWGAGWLLGLMFTCSLVAALSDFIVDRTGYVWLTVNVLAGTYYVLAVRYEMKRSALSDFTLVYYNNLVTVTLLAPALLFAEVPNRLDLFFIPLSPSYVSLWLLNGVGSFLIGLSSFWVIRHTSATTFSMLGALSKLPLSVAATYLFPSDMPGLTVSMVALGLCAAVAYTWQKHNRRNEAQRRLLKNRSDLDLTQLDEASGKPRYRTSV